MIVVEFVEYEMYFGQLDVVLIGPVVEAVVTIVVVDVAGMREAVEEREHVLEAVAVQMLVGDGHEEFVGGGESQLGDYRERRVDVNEHDELDALAFGYFAYEVLERARHVLPRLHAVVRQRRMGVAFLFEGPGDEVERRVAAQEVEVARELRVEFRHVEEKCARIDYVRCWSALKFRIITKKKTLELLSLNHYLTFLDLKNPENHF